MSSEPEPGGESVADSAHTLARLGVQVEALQALLVRVLQEVVEKDVACDTAEASPLAQVNEKLVLAALTHQVQAEAASLALETAERAARLDALTGLPNRATLLDRLPQVMAGSKRRGSPSALIFLDLDDFKALNDTHGHLLGDKALQLAAQRMLAVVREIDTVSRYGGDEFVVLLPELATIADARIVADKLLASIAVPAQIDGTAVNLSANLGIAIFPDDGQDPATLVAKADAAMYESKRRRNGGLPAHVDPSQSGATPQAPRSPDRSAEVPWRVDDLREANEKLIQAALSAQELKDAAESALQRQTAVMVAVADELANPDAPIRIATAMLGQLGSEVPALSQMRRILEAQAAHTSQLIGKLIDAAEPEAHGLNPKHAVIDMQVVVDTAIARNKIMMDARSQRLAIDRPAGRLEVLGDASMLELAVSNLLDNASKHTYNGGHIDLVITRHEDTLGLTVSDNGIGITPSMVPCISFPFLQDTQALGFNGVGLGIGLTVVRTVVRAHGGSFAVHSAGLKRGSRFALTLPTAGRADQVVQARN